MELKKRILVVDDNESTLKVIKAILEREKYTVYTAPGWRPAMKIAEEEDIHLCLTDLKMPEVDGLAFFEKLKAVKPEIKVVLMTAYGSVDSAVRAMKLGAENYLQKPLNFDELKITTAKIFEKIELKKEVELLKGLREGRDIFENMIGRSKRMREVFKKIGNIAKTDSTVMIFGESGTGKEMAARAVHNMSKRAANKLVSINLAAIPEGLQESELFGFEKGAFTGAHAARKGKFEAAHGGTVFLDEIGNINHRVQSKLLRVLEERRVEPLGANKSFPVDVRIISATNADLKAQVASGAFREDLFYRLDVISLVMPPLRERKADIPLLVDAFITEVCVRNNFPVKKMSESALDLLMEHNWPGNIRELRNVIEEAVVISDGDIIRPELLNISSRETRDSDTMGRDISELPLSELEKKSIINALIKSRGNQTKAAKMLGITRKMIMTKIEKYGISNIVPVRTRHLKKSQ